MKTGSFEIRRAEPGDEPGAYAVCLQTGDGGKGAAHLYDDPRALGHIYVGPYLKLEPDLAFVLGDPEGVCGYVLGALESRTFYHAYVHDWLPGIRHAHPKPTGDPASWTRTQKLYYEYYHPVFEGIRLDVGDDHLGEHVLRFLTLLGIGFIDEADAVLLEEFEHAFEAVGFGDARAPFRQRRVDLVVSERSNHRSQH